MPLHTFLLLLLTSTAYTLNEPVIDNIAVEPLSPACKQRQTNTVAGSTCYDWEGKAIIGPSPYPCPCLDNDKSGGAFPGTGKPEMPNTFKNGFNDYTIGQNAPKDFTSLSGMAFTDNTKEIFLVSKEGKLFRIDMQTEVITDVYDFTDQVHNVGDYGGLSVETHTNFGSNPYVYVSYVNAALAGNNTEFNTISFVRVMRITMSNGQMTDKKFIIGTDYMDSNVLCSSSHAGGALAMGLDGSLFITLGEGSHFDTDVMDFGQVQARYEFSALCQQLWPGQAMGSLKAQSKDTLGGKLIRVDPATGDGICSGGNPAFTVYNPYCVPGEGLRTPRSRIYAMGFRNPFSMNVRPRADGETGPGVPYVGDVGLGSFEEVNAVTQPGLNFGWPCWEGPLPMGGMRQTPMNDLTYPDSTIIRPKNDAGQNFSCTYVYASVVTQHPTYYWSRYTHQMAGLYGEEYVLGAGFTGNCVSGVGFYTGTKYPSIYQGQIFFSDYGTQWIKSFTANQDQFVTQYDFAPLSVPLVDLETNPTNGDLCYLELLAGAVHCIGYQSGPQAPVVVAAANPSAGAAPLAVTFSSDGSYDLSNGAVNFVFWDFGDGSNAVAPNPTHTYTNAGAYTATLYINIGVYNITQSVKVRVGASSPVPQILQPTTGATSSFSFTNYSTGSVTYSGSATGGTPPFSYFWDIYMVHTNHYHPESYTSTKQSFTATLNEMGAGSHVGERINFLAILQVTDANGLTGVTFTRMSETNWTSNAPVPSFSIQSPYPLTTGQFVRFDASKTYDVDLDTITYLWDFGDGTKIGFNPKTNNKYISHAYANPGFYTITLTTVDNWGIYNTTTQSVTVNPGYVQYPPKLAANGVPLVLIPGASTIPGATVVNIPTTPSDNNAGNVNGGNTISGQGSSNTNVITNAPKSTATMVSVGMTLLFALLSI